MPRDVEPAIIRHGRGRYAPIRGTASTWWYRATVPITGGRDGAASKRYEIMSVVVVCKCGKRFRAKEEHVGKRAKCPACGHILVICGKATPRDTSRTGYLESRTDSDVIGGASTKESQQHDRANRQGPQEDSPQPNFHEARGQTSERANLRTLASTVTVLSYVCVLITIAAHGATVFVDAPPLRFVDECFLAGALVLGVTAYLLFRLAGRYCPTPPKPPLNRVGFLPRFMAQFVDGLILLPAGGLFLLAGWVLQPGVYGAFAMNLVWLTCVWLYFSLLESSDRQATFGKRAFGIYVVDKGGQRISFCRAGGRYLAEYLSMGLFFLGYLMVGFTREREALHDKLAGTLVVGSGGWPVEFGEVPGYCPRCQERILVRMKTMNHGFHLIVVLLTGGLWLPFWIVSSMFFVGWRCTRCGSRAKRTLYS